MVGDYTMKTKPIQSKVNECACMRAHHHNIFCLFMHKRPHRYSTNLCSQNADYSRYLDLRQLPQSIKDNNVMNAYKYRMSIDKYRMGWLISTAADPS
jgi:hypothetical protein